MIYSFSLQVAALIAGILLCLFSVVGFLVKNAEKLRGFPRSRWAGIIILTIDLIWSWWLLAVMDMGEFSSFRRPLLIALPIAYILSIRFMDEFLAVRALGIFALLAAEPLLEAAFFRYETSRLVLTVLAYVMIVLGMIWVTMPYRLRDQLDWLGKTSGRWRGFTAFGFLYGAALIALACAAY